MVPRALRAAHTQARGSARASDACWLERGGCVMPYSAAENTTYAASHWSFGRSAPPPRNGLIGNGESRAGVWPGGFRDVGRFSGMNLGSNGIIAEHPVYIKTRANFPRGASRSM